MITLDPMLTGSGDNVSYVLVKVKTGKIDGCYPKQYTTVNSEGNKACSIGGKLAM